jgi:hypothetical protein
MPYEAARRVAGRRGAPALRLRAAPTHSYGAEGLNTQDEPDNRPGADPRLRSDRQRHKRSAPDSPDHKQDPDAHLKAEAERTSVKGNRQLRDGIGSYPD